MPDRKVVKKFFEYKLDNKEVKRDPVKPALIIILALIGAVAGVMLQNQPSAVGLAVIGLVVGYMISRRNANVEYDRRLKERSC